MEASLVNAHMEAFIETSLIDAYMEASIETSLKLCPQWGINSCKASHYL